MRHDRIIFVSAVHSVCLFSTLSLQAMKRKERKKERAIEREKIYDDTGGVKWMMMMRMEIESN